jgi:hypothetical protein
MILGVMGTVATSATVVSDIAVAHDITPFITTYPWSDTTGFGVKYANPASLPAGYGQGVDFRPGNGVVIEATGVTPFVEAWPWNAGFGTKYSNPATLPAGLGNYVKFSGTGNDVAVAHSNSPYVSAYPWSSGFGAKYANPATLPTGNAWGLNWTTDSASIGMGHSTSPFVTAYPWSAGFGTKYANPATLPTATGGDVSWRTTNNYVGVKGTTAGGQGFNVYAWSAGFGTKVTDAATNFAVVDDIEFSPNGSYFAAATTASPYINVWNWSGTGFGTKIANPATLPTGSGYGCAWSSSGNSIACAHDTSPFVTVYPFTTSFGTKFANPATLPTGTGYDTNFTR